MLRKDVNVSWHEQLTNTGTVSSEVHSRRTKMAGHCAHHSELVAHLYTLQEPEHSTAKRV